MDQIGRYRIVGELGRGAMGVVYLAVDPAIGRHVAIKTIRIRDIDDTRQRDRLSERLFREARSAGVLSHPNIVTIYDIDEAEGVAFIAMAYVNGPTLEKVLASDQALSGARMLGVLRQTAMALDYAHGRGIVHRDVKPANIMTDEDGSVKITDFGIARMASAGQLNETRTIAGTPNYMSPEQVQGFAVDGRSDQFSLGVIAYEILTGERPFVGEHLSTIVYKIVGEAPAGAHLLNGTLTAAVDEVLQKALAKKPEERYPNCVNFVFALELACAESRGWQTLPAGAAAVMPTMAREADPVSVPVVAPAASASIHPPPPPPQSLTQESLPARKPFWTSLLMSLCVVGGVAAVFLYQSGLLGHSDTPAAAPMVQTPEERPAPLDPKPAPFPSAESEKAPDPSPPTDTQDAVSAGGPEPVEAKPEEAKPTGPKPADAKPVETEPAPPPRHPVQAPSRPADVSVTTNPAGAKVVLDDILRLSCTTPCALLTAPGDHQLTFSRAGYQNEYRQVYVAGGVPVEVPLVTLTPVADGIASGTLMLTTSPAGARVRINGEPVSQTTPAELHLRPGTYTVTVEKNGVSRTEKIQMRESPYYLRIPLNP